MHERSHVTGPLLQSGDGNGVDESALQEVTMAEARETSNAVGDHFVADVHAQTEEFARDGDVTVRWTSTDETGALRGHDGQCHFDVVMTFGGTECHVMKSALRQREGETRVGTRRPAPFSPTRARRSEQTWFLGSADFRRFGGHRGAHGAGR